MATTDPNLAVAILDALENVGVGFVVLHGEAATARGETFSDVDIAVDRPAADALRAISPRLTDLGLAPVMLWPYDIGGTASVFVANQDASGGVQVDMLFDPAAKGQYGLFSEKARAAAVPGDRWSRLESRYEMAYRVRKRAAKAQTSALKQMADEIEDKDEVLRAAAEMFTDEGLRVVRSWAEDPTRVRLGVSKPKKVGRMWNRLRLPVGFAVFVTDDPRGVLDDISVSFSGFLPHVDIFEAPSSGPSRAKWYMTEVAPRQWRPGLVVAVGGPPSGLYPFDLLTDGRSIDASTIVEAMAARVVKRLNR